MRRFLYILILFLALSSTSDARKKPKDLITMYPALAPYFSTPSTEAMQPDEKGFIRKQTYHGIEKNSDGSWKPVMSTDGYAIINVVYGKK